MDRTPTPAHASHDEMLIARLYGGDVDSGERAAALDRIAECPDCADLFADLTAIAEADAAMRVPSRPRDFSLTEADGARLRRKRRLGWLFGAGLRRSLGGSLAALAVAGVVLTGVASIVGGTQNTDRFTLQDQSNHAPVAAAASGADSAAFGAMAPTAAPVVSAAAIPAASPAPLSAATAAPAPPASTERDLATSAPVVAAPSPVATVAALGSGAGPLATGEVAKVAQSSEGAAGNGQPPSVLPTEVAQSGIDARAVWLAGFVVLFAIGMAIALLPWRRPGRGRRGGS